MPRYPISICKRIVMGSSSMWARLVGAKHLSTECESSKHGKCQNAHKTLCIRGNSLIIKSMTLRDAVKAMVLQTIYESKVRLEFCASVDWRTLQSYNNKKKIALELITDREICTNESSTRSSLIENWSRDWYIIVDSIVGRYLEIGQ